MVVPVFVRAAVLALIVAGCGASATPTPAGIQLSSSPAPASVASEMPSLVPGNSAVAPLPTDAPAMVRNLTRLPSCGAEVLFEQDVDISPIPTAPGPTTDPTANQQATDCLISAWQNKAPAELDVSSISDEADEIYTMYRLPGDGTLQQIVRVKSHSDKTVTWTVTVCKQISIQEGTVTPSECESEAPISS
jgi:hypothetical protein